MNTISKTHSKQDLLDIVNTLNLKITISHGDCKKDIQTKYYDYLSNKNDNITYEKNAYNINDKISLQSYLINKTPKKILNVKDKKAVMSICKNIISYCNNSFWLPSNNYETEKEIQDDMLFIIQFGDLPSVRRCCRLMNSNPMKSPTTTYDPIVSPEIQKELQEKHKSKTMNQYMCKFKRGPITIYFS